MQHEIKRYPVQHPLLRNYIKFFWELRVDYLQLNHNLIPQRNINLRLNLSSTPQYVSINGNRQSLENIHVAGLQDHFRNASLIANGPVHVMGICFLPDGFYPFFKIPASEFTNQLLGLNEIGCRFAHSLCDRLNEAPGSAERITLLEQELLALLVRNNPEDENFRQIFKALNQKNSSMPISGFCKQHDIGLRRLERMFSKYVGISAAAYGTLNRFQNGLNQILYNNYSRLSDIAFDNGYFDQMHFIREFKHFTGNTPKIFARRNNTILQIGKLR